MDEEQGIDPDRGWEVLPVFDGNRQLTEALQAMMSSDEAPGHSDVGIQNLLYSEILNNRPRRVLEIGTHIGTASVIMGSALMRNGYGKLLTLEPQAHYQDIAAKNVEAAGVSSCVEILPFFSYQQECQDRLEEEAPFDLIFIDGAHDYESARHDIELCYSLLRINGLMILHDVGKRSPLMDPGGNGGVRRALHDFSEANPESRVIFREYPIWLNECGAALVTKQLLNPLP